MEPDPSPGHSQRSRILPKITGIALALSLAAGFGLAPTSGVVGAETSAQDSFARSSARGWGTTDSGSRWAYPSGKGGIAIVRGEGVIRHPRWATPKAALLNLKLRNTAVRFTLGLESGSAGPSPKAVAVLRKSAGGEYRLGVRVGNDGKVWLSVAKSRTGGKAKGLGKPVAVSGWRYRPGDTLGVVAQAVKRNPTQLRMKVWKVGAKTPSKWQIVRNDVRKDIEASGRMGLMSIPTGKPKATVGLRIDDLVARPARSTKRAPSDSSESSPTPAPAPKAPAPTPPPAPTNAVYVPASIDSTGSKNVAGALQSVIDQAPNGSTIVFKAGATYQLGEVLRIANRKGITLAGNGATLKLTGPGDYYGTGILVERFSANTTIRDLTIAGNHAAAGTSKACCGREGQHGIGIHSSSNTLIKRVKIRRVGGDCFNIANWYDQWQAWSDGVTIRDSVCRLTGRMGAHIPAATNVRIVGNVFDEIGYSVIGIEPNNGQQGARGIVIKDNTIGSYSLTDNYLGNLFYALNAPWGGGATVQDVTITGNTIEGNRNGYNGAMLGLNVRVEGDVSPRDYTVTNNTAHKAVNGPVVRFTDAVGVTVTGNSQPLGSGELARFYGSSSNITYDG